MLRTNLSEIRSTGRATQGVTIFKLDDDDAVSAIACVGELEAHDEPKGLPDLEVKPGANGQAQRPCRAQEREVTRTRFANETKTGTFEKTVSAHAS